MYVEEIIERCRKDLAEIDDNLRWCMFDGYRETNADYAPVVSLSAPQIDGSEPRPQDPPDPTPAPVDPDHVRAPRFDIGIGDDRSRRAYHRSIEHLRRAEGFLACACYLAVDERATTPRMLKPGPQASLSLLVECLGRMRARLYLLEKPPRVQLDDGGHLRLHPPAVTGEAVKALNGAARELERAWKILAHAFERGPIEPEQAFATSDMCRICKLRPRVDKKGGRCHTCSQWFTRNGFERPTKLDGVHDAIAAKRRRQSRGEGWGDESFSGASA